MTIIKQGNTYHAELNVPKDVQYVLGRRRFRKTLNTTDIKEAQRKEPFVVSAWKEKIAIARNKGGDIHELSQIYKESSEEAQFELEEMFQDIVVDDYGKTHLSQLTPEENKKALYKYQLLTGQKIKIEVLLDEWLESWPVQQKGKEQGARYIRKFCSRFEITEKVTKASLMEWCDYLIKHEGLSSKTVRCRLSPCKVYWEFLEIKGYVNTNPFTNINLNNTTFKNVTQSRESFSNEEIKHIFNEIKKISNSEPQLFQLYQIAIYTGARIEEICKIKTTEVSETSIRIVNSKTQAGIREVPIHSKICNLINDLKLNSTDTYLIGNLKINRLGQRSAAIGKKFGRLKTKLGFKKGVHVFHSIRNTVITKLEQADVSESVTADIVGHEKKTITYGLYSGGSSMAQKIEAIEKIKY